MENTFVRIIVFAVLNFGALGIGAYLMGQGAASEWYQGLNKAPWTPPGWVFGAAWITIMVCFTVYKAQLWKYTDNIKMLIVLFVIQWILNVSWNPAFFKFHQVLLGLILLILLTVVVGKLLIDNGSLLKLNSLWILPYFIWLLVATSLNAYVLFKNEPLPCIHTTIK